jgi:hypothetical protein
MPRITVGLRLRPVNENEKTIFCNQQVALLLLHLLILVSKLSSFGLFFYLYVCSPRTEPQSNSLLRELNTNLFLISKQTVLKNFYIKDLKHLY